MMVRLSDRERETFDLAAQRRGISVSELVRRTASMLEMMDKIEGSNVAITLGDKLVGLVAGL